VPRPEYSEAAEVQEIAEKLIEKHYGFLEGVTVVYIFRSEARKSKGKSLLGKAHKKSGLDAFLIDQGEELFVLEVAADEWKALNQKQRVALVDHVLMHFDYDDEKDQLTIRGPDLEEFTDIVKRHGLWRPAVEQFVQAGLPFTKTKT
jgi:predicted metallopeptidase